jgi:hypothetical protein
MLIQTNPECDDQINSELGQGLLGEDGSLSWLSEVISHDRHQPSAHSRTPQAFHKVPEIATAWLGEVFDAMLNATAALSMAYVARLRHGEGREDKALSTQQRTSERGFGHAGS